MDGLYRRKGGFQEKTPMILNTNQHFLENSRESHTITEMESYKLGLIGFQHFSMGLLLNNQY